MNTDVESLDRFLPHIVEEELISGACSEHQRLIARCAATISARLPKWKSGGVWVLAMGVAPVPGWPRRRSIQAVARPSERAGPMSWYWLWAVCRIWRLVVPEALRRPSM